MFIKDKNLKHQMQKDVKWPAIRKSAELEQVSVRKEISETFLKNRFPTKLKLPSILIAKHLQNRGLWSRDDRERIASSVLHSRLQIIKTFS